MARSSLCIAFNNERTWLFMPDDEQRARYRVTQDDKYTKNDFKKLGPIESNSTSASPELLMSFARWPHMPQIATKAPMLIRDDYGWSPKATQTRGLLKAMRVANIMAKILDYLPYLDQAHLFATCQDAFRVACFAGYWNLSGEQNAAESTPQADKHGKASDVLQHCQESNLRVTPHHLAEYDEINGEKFRKVPWLSQNLRATQQLLVKLHHSANNIRRLELHRVSFLNVMMVKHIVEGLPNLTYLGVFLCLLVTYGHTPWMVEIVGEHQHRRKSNLILDLYPCYHRGAIVTDAFEGRIEKHCKQSEDNQVEWGSVPLPRTNGCWSEADKPYRRWSSGVCWGKTPYRSYLGVFSIFIYLLWPRLVKYGMTDMLQEGKAFRLYMERLPLPKYALLRVIEALMARDAPGKLPKENREQEFAHDNLAAVTGNTLPLKYKALMSEKKKCKGCQQTQFKIFYGKRQATCLGCCLNRDMDGERDHFKPAQKDIARYLLSKTDEDEEDTLANRGALWEESQRGYIEMHRNLADIVAAIESEEGNMQRWWLDCAAFIANQADQMRAQQMAPDYSSLGMDASNGMPQDLLTRMNRVYCPTGPVDRIRHDYQTYSLGAAGRRAGGEPESYVTEADIQARLAEEERGTNGGVGGLSGHALKERKKQIRRDMDKEDRFKILEARTQHIALEAQLWRLPSDDWDELLSTWSCDEKWNESHHEKIYRDNSWYDQQLIKSGVEKW